MQGRNCSYEELNIGLESQKTMLNACLETFYILNFFDLVQNLDL